MALTLDALRRRLLEQAEQDSQYNQVERELNLGLQQGEADTLFANQRDETENARSMAELGQQRDRTLTANDESLADRGILRSGANLVSRGRIGEQYAQNSESLARRLSGSKEDRARQLQQMKADTQRRLDDLKLQRARTTTDREQQKAVDDAESSAAQMAAQAEQAQQQQEEAARVAAMQPQYTPTGQYLPPDPGEGEAPNYPSPWGEHDTPSWQAQNAQKPQGGNMPEWQRMGFPSEAAWAAVYRRMGG